VPLRLVGSEMCIRDSSEVAYQVGFNDPAYFTRAFKKQYGRTPKSFINHEKN
jgi:AraC-like DNA-binding protein